MLSINAFRRMLQLLATAAGLCLVLTPATAAAGVSADAGWTAEAGSMMDPDGARLLSEEGSMMDPDGARQLSEEGSMMDPDGARLLSEEGSMMDPDGLRTDTPAESDLPR